MTMRERIINGKLFTDECEGLPAERTAAKKKMISFILSLALNKQKEKRLSKSYFSKIP